MNERGAAAPFSFGGLDGLDHRFARCGALMGGEEGVRFNALQARRRGKWVTCYFGDTGRRDLSKAHSPLATSKLLLFPKKGG